MDSRIILEDLPETEAKDKPYRYSRTFEVSVREKSAPEMDKRALMEYIKKILGTEEPETVQPQAA